ncbi:hypothetical protein [Paenibacillus chitinolyticus]|uniref:hypothetical protein n=1 Tax=Paenibacillus chitinolyticus TaxID=79263 RepID=UPI001C46337B|nr:hypothetical protein [Paenibacillus chitinolyticus]MBV6717167.1 hypothetical protein [Paenibacillus chitinolyticus]
MNKLADLKVQKETYQYLFYLINESVEIESILISSDLEDIIQHAKKTTRAFLDGDDAWVITDLPERYSDYGLCKIVKLKKGVPASEYHQVIWTYCCDGEERLEDSMEKIDRI